MNIVLKRRRCEDGRFLPKTADESLELLAKMYRELLSIEVDLDQAVIPVREQGFDRLIVIPKGLHMEPIRTIFEDLFGGEIHNRHNFSSLHDYKNERNPNEIYAVWVSKSVVPDLRGVSDNGLERLNIPSMTLLEGSINHLFYWYISEGKHLEGFTVCSGSECDSGYIPCVGLTAESKLYIGSVEQDEVLSQFGQWPMGARRVIPVRKQPIPQY